MSSRPYIVKYTEEYSEELTKLLLQFSEEVYGEAAASLESFVLGHWCIYLAKVNNEVIGFTSFTYNTYYGLRKPTVAIDYLYVTPEHRTTRAAYLMCMQAGVISTTNNLPLEQYHATEESAKIGKKMKGTQLYTAYIYEVDEVKKQFKHMNTKIQIKET